ncbi:MAG: hypothetical protein RIQ89_1956 [Bacteroidota bacterium]
MVNFKRTILPNGLKLIVHTDTTSPLVNMNILYNVGARDEDPSQTGFAHLFEHLMFGGSIHIPEYDSPLQLAGGDNNAFTNNDITNYYLTLPAANIETGFWLESDRMLSLAFSEKSLEVQRNVVVEEFKQRYLNQPYGDAWLLLRPLAYKVHPYQWATIGKEISHIEQATLNDVKNFFFNYYNPDNAVLVLSGNISFDEAHRLAMKWFAPIERTSIVRKPYAVEPIQTEARSLTVERDVPISAIYKAFHCCKRTDQTFYAVDLATDILSRGKSSRLYNSLVKKQKLFTDINLYCTGDFDNGLVVVDGKLSKGVKMEEAERGLNEELQIMSNLLVSDEELVKVKNKVESIIEFSEIDLGNRSLGLALGEVMGDANQVNLETERYKAVTAEQIRQEALKIFDHKNSNTLYYLSKN